jgi:hypothetical protein
MGSRTTCALPRLHDWTRLNLTTTCMKWSSESASAYTYRVDRRPAMAAGFRSSPGGSKTVVEFDCCSTTFSPVSSH